jgi:hypothetical protein
MQRSLFLASAAMLAAMAGNAPAEGVHKCVTAVMTSYQSAPCADPSSEAKIAPVIVASARGIEDAVAPDDSAQRDAPVALTENSVPITGRLPFGRVPLAVGMYDVEALNSPRWGRPDAIARSRDRRGWREIWTYDRGGDGPRELEFLNGRLIAISPHSDAVRIASAASR